MWRLRPSAREKASALQESLVKPETSDREIASITGLIMWFHYISLRPLLEIDGVIKLTSKIGKAAVAPLADWNKRMALAPEERELLRAY